MTYGINMLVLKNKDQKILFYFAICMGLFVSSVVKANLCGDLSFRVPQEQVVATVPFLDQYPELFEQFDYWRLERNQGEDSGVWVFSRADAELRLTIDTGRMSLRFPNQKPVRVNGEVAELYRFLSRSQGEQPEASLDEGLLVFYFPLNENGLRTLLRQLRQ